MLVSRVRQREGKVEEETKTDAFWILFLDLGIDDEW